MLLRAVLLLWATAAAAIAANQVVVVTVATNENDHGLKRYLESAERYGITVRVLGLNEEWNGGDTRIETGGGQKIRILREALEEFKDDKETIIVFTDAYDVVWTNGVDELVDRFSFHYKDLRVLFSAEPFCWPNKELAADYPLVEFGKRFLNSGMWMGYGAEVYKMLTVTAVADKDDDQLYFTMIYLDEKMRRDLKMGLDSISRVFQNLNGVEHDVQLSFDTETGEARVANVAYNTHPILLHGNGAAKTYLNYLGNYVGEWSAEKGCRRCEQRNTYEKEKEEDKISEELPVITLAVFVGNTPFAEEFLNALALQDYPKTKIHLFLYNKAPIHVKTCLDWAESHRGEFASRQILNVDANVGERDARQKAIEVSQSREAEFTFFIDSYAYLLDTTALRRLVNKIEFYEFDILSTLLNQPNKLFSNFWGAIASNGFYARSEDYIPLVQRKRVGVWNVPLISTAFLVRNSLLSSMSTPFHYDKNIDADMSFALYCRHKGLFQYISNENNDGFLIVYDEFEEDLGKNRLHPEMWQIFSNRYLWEKRYLHESYAGLLHGAVEDVPLACPDVYDYPLLSPRFCEEIIGEMEHFGQWSDGTNVDKRLDGGYENVPTRDIHMNQIEFERQWLFFLDEYVRPMQEKVFIGYFKKPVESSMMFVVRYRPDEQASLRPHHDASTFSIDIALNKKGRDYEGGGVRYVRYNCTVDADEVGYTMMFPGRLTHLHEGLPTTKGTRYILVSFINP